MRISIKYLAQTIAILLMFIVSGCGLTSEDKPSEPPEFSNVEVHDPSIYKNGDTYYIFGSHLAAAKSTDLMSWEQISTLPRPNNPLFPEVDETLAAAIDYAETNTFWAPDVVQLKDGTYAFYYNACKGDRPQSVLGLALSESIDGPYEDKGIFLTSGVKMGVSNDGTTYNANVHPNAVDPHTFYDEEGQMWMVYGSYSGGIFIMKMNDETGFPLESQGYGTKLLGGYHARIEGPYILYSKDTDYYYLFLSFGGLDANGGYNIRVARSKEVDGPYYDSEGNALIDAMGVEGKIFYDQAYEPYGHKLVGNFSFESPDEDALVNYGYVSPGHNSAYYDDASDQYYLIFHTRFPKSGNAHQVRVHQFFFNDEGWPVMAPIRYGGETLTDLTESDVVGSYQVVDHGHDITKDIKSSVLMKLQEDGTITNGNGHWRLYDKNKIEITMNDVVYTGYFIEQYDSYVGDWTITFTAGSETGTSIWGIMEEK